MGGHSLVQTVFMFDHSGQKLGEGTSELPEVVHECLEARKASVREKKDTWEPSARAEGQTPELARDPKSR